MQTERFSEKGKGVWRSNRFREKRKDFGEVLGSGRSERVGMKLKAG